MPFRMNRRTFLRGAVAAVAAGAVGTPLVLHGIRTHAIEEKTVRFTLGLRQRLRLVALGDIHFDPLYEVEYLAGLARAITALEADLIVYTGDFVTGSVRRMSELAGILSGATARLGSFATLGNHDHWAGAAPITHALAQNGIRVLRNDLFALPGEDHVYLTGLDSVWAGKPDPRLLERTPPDSRHIVLLHEPDPFAQLTDPRLRLQISGHTHGGQVRAPLVGALVLPKYGRHFQSGLYLRDNRGLYVNRGIGTLYPHVRYRCRPEVTVFELT